MSGGNFSPSKRNREMDQARKKQEKAQRRQEKRERGPGEIPVTTADMVQRGLPSIEEAMRNIENRSRGIVAQAATIPARLFVSGLADDVTEADLRATFGVYGPVADAVVMVDRGTKAPRGFGFVTMANRRDAPKAIELLDGSELKGRRLVVNVATER
jgi:RNA recognition motif-containing protein